MQIFDLQAGHGKSRRPIAYELSRLSIEVCVFSAKAFAN